MGDLLMREQSGDGVSWLPPVLEGTFPDLLPAGASARPPPPVWLPTQTGHGGPLGPHVTERGGIQINGRGRALAHEALHREGSGKKHLGNTQEETVKLKTHRQGDAHTGLGQRPGSQTVTSLFRSHVISASQ